MGKSLERLLVNLPGWIFVLVGMSILSISLLVPAYIDSQKLAWQHDLLKLQAKRWSEQEHNYRQFAKALESNDPVVLQQLAVYQLRLKPAGTAQVDPLMVTTALNPHPGPQKPVPITTVRNNGHGQVYATTVMVPPPTPLAPSAPIVPTIESMLRKPIPVAGVTYPNYELMPSRVVRITTGPMRWPFVAAGFLLVVAGLIAKTRSDIVEEPEEAVEETPAVTDEETEGATLVTTTAAPAAEPTATTATTAAATSADAPVEPATTATASSPVAAAGTAATTAPMDTPTAAPEVAEEIAEPASAPAAAPAPVEQAKPSPAAEA